MTTPAASPEPAPLVLDAEEQRVLGSLLEKEVTVPASYPLTLNAVRTACNQSSSREPVVDYDERTVNETLKRLRDRDLVTTSWAGSGQRTVKFAETLAARAGWSAEVRAVLTVLLLRGPQPAGALKTRTERLHGFADRADVELTLQALATADPPLVRQLPKQPGQQDPRWIHLLGPVSAAPNGVVEPAETNSPALEAALHDGATIRDRRIVDSYAAVAADYATAMVDELAPLPFERWLLGRVVDLADGHPMVDAGCGPGHLTAHLSELGAQVTGIDLTPAMVQEARRRYPNLSFEVGDLRDLLRPSGAAGWGAVLGWYSLIHLASSELEDAIAALVRPLRPGGWLLLGMQAGAEVIRLPRWFEHDIELDFVLHPPAAVVAAAQHLNLTDLEWYHRGRQRDELTERFYLLARKPA